MKKEAVVVLIAVILTGGAFLGLRVGQPAAQTINREPGTSYVIIPLGAGQNRTLPGPAATLKGQGYEPDVLKVVIGVNNTVVWINQDKDVVFGLSFSVPHTVTNPQGAFDSGVLSTGDTFTHIFDAPGSYYYHCDYHPWQKGMVIVTGP